MNIRSFPKTTPLHYAATSTTRLRSRTSDSSLLNAIRRRQAAKTVREGKNRVFVPSMNHPHGSMIDPRLIIAMIGNAFGSHYCWTNC